MADEFVDPESKCRTKHRRHNLRVIYGKVTNDGSIVSVDGLGIGALPACVHTRMEHEARSMKHEMYLVHTLLRRRVGGAQFWTPPESDVVVLVHACESSEQLTATCLAQAERGKEIGRVVRALMWSRCVHIASW